MATSKPKRFALPLLTMPIKSKEDNIKDKIKELGITEDNIIRIDNEINVSYPKLTENRVEITAEEFKTLSVEQRQKIHEKGKIIVIIDKDPYHNIVSSLYNLFDGLKHMSNSNVLKLYDEIKMDINQEPNIEFTIIKSPLSGRLIAHVNKLIWNGEDLLKGQNIMLYQSTGESRSTGLGGYWMPTTGEMSNRTVAKLEDEYILALEYVLEHSGPIRDDTKPLLIDIITNIATFNKYKRFITKTYLIASYLLFLNSNNYISTHPIRDYTDEEKENALHNIIKHIPETNRYIPITAELVDELIKPYQTGSGDKYYYKYIKYKNKYAMLKNRVLQH